MKFTHYALWEKNYEAYVSGATRIVNQGATWSGKTVNILLLLAEIAIQRKKPTRIGVFSESLPHLRLGAMRDFERILMGNGWYNEADHNKTEHRYNFRNNFIQFVGCDAPGKATGPRWDITYFNEVINVSKSVVEQVEMRTEICMFFDYNPQYEFWIIDKMVEWGESCRFIKSTYEDGLQFIPPDIRKMIEGWKANNPNRYTVFAMGEWGSLEGRIYDFEILKTDGIPLEAELIGYGVDFGFSVDPTAVVACYRWNGGIIADEVWYQKGMPEDIWPKIQDEVKQHVPAYGDNANGIYIEMFNRSGWRRLKACLKPNDTKEKSSIRFGIQQVQQNPLWLTKRSVNGIKEARGYSWATDNFGKPMGDPVGKEHFLDGLRYLVQTLAAKPKVTPRSVSWRKPFADERRVANFGL